MRLVALLSIGFLLLAFSSTPPGRQTGAATANPFRAFGVIANNAFFYYADLDRATRFYTETLGFRLAADYGYAKILRLADSSYLILVDATKGMHPADEPRTTALAIVTDQLDEWYAHLKSRQVPLRGPYEPKAGRPHDGFVAVDPEGYFLEFERFNPHPENVKLTPVLASLSGLRAAPSSTASASPPAGLSVKATVLWLYYRDLPAAQRFYEQRLGFVLIVDQGWAKIYRTSSSGFIGLVDESRGMHRATEKKAVTVSFFTRDIDGWFAHVKDHQAFALRSDAVHPDPEGRFRAFVGYDPEGYFLEFDVFLDHPQNRGFVTALNLAAQTYPPPFPRDGATKLLENDRVIVWDVTWPKGRPTAMHRHAHDIVGVFVADGTRMITRADGTRQESVTKAGDAVYSPTKDVVHIEEGTSDPPTRAILLELKEDAPSGQVEMSGDLPPAFPREGAKALLDNARVTIWEYQWAPGSRIPLHRHVRDAVVVWLADGKLRSIPQSGEPGTIDAAFGRIRWGQRGTVHSEEVVEGSPRGVVIELK